jgi:hypothetical protein
MFGGIVSISSCMSSDVKGYFTHTIPFSCRSPAALIKKCLAVPLPFSDSAMSFVKVRMVDGNIRNASPATTLYSNNLRGTPLGSRKKPNAGRSPTCHLWTADANSHIPCRSHAALCRGLEKSLLKRHSRGMAWERHWRGMACVNQTRPHCVNQMGKTQFKPLAERHGKGMAWERHGMCELPLNFQS